MEKVPELIKKNKRKRLIRTEAWKGQAKMFIYLVATRYYRVATRY